MKLTATQVWALKQVEASFYGWSKLSTGTRQSLLKRELVTIHPVKEIYVLTEKGENALKHAEVTLALTPQQRKVRDWLEGEQDYTCTLMFLLKSAGVGLGTIESMQHRGLLSMSTVQGAPWVRAEGDLRNWLKDKAMRDAAHPDYED